MATIQGVYLALFGRPADPAGLAYFNGVTNNGANLAAIGDLSSQAEYTTRFTGQTNTQIVQSIYQSLFGREGEAGGVNFFVQQLTSGAQTISTIAINILDGAVGSDLALVNKKLAAADLFTRALDTPAEVANYSGTAAAQKGAAYLTAVTATSPTVTSADADTAVAGLGAGSSNSQTLTISSPLTAPITIPSAVENLTIQFENNTVINDAYGITGDFVNVTATGSGGFTLAFLSGRVDIYSSKLKVFDASGLSGGADVDFISPLGVRVIGSKSADSIDFYSPDQGFILFTTPSPENGDNTIVYNAANISTSNARDSFSDFFHGGTGDKVDVSSFTITEGKTAVTKFASIPSSGESFNGNAVAVADSVPEDGGNPTDYIYFVDTNGNGVVDLDSDLSFSLSVESVGSYLTADNFIF